MTEPEPFRALSMEDFERLTIQQKVDYLRSAAEAQKRFSDQFEKYLEQVRKDAPK
jgi:hypothetical protein